MYRYGQAEIDAVARVIRSGQWFRYGDSAKGHLGETKLFEQELAAYMGTKHACFMSHGTTSLMCCYAGLGMGPGDEVIIPGFTWVASALAPMNLGIVPVIVDVDESLTISPEAIEKAITPRTKAINPIHMAGLACDMDAITDIAKRKGLYIVEDACQCDGGLWHDGRKLGTIGDTGAYSFNYYKVISCGEGGAFVCQDEEVFERGVIYHDSGCNFFSGQPKLPMFGGLIVRGNELMAAMMRVQLQRLPGIVADLQQRRADLELRLQTALPKTVRTGLRYGGARTGTGAVATLMCQDEASARRLMERYRATPAAALCAAWIPIDSGRHVYANWESVMQRRGSYHPDLNAFNLPQNAGSTATYSPTMLPRTLELLKRSVILPINPDWTTAELDTLAQGFTGAATGL